MRGVSTPRHPGLAPVYTHIHYYYDLLFININILVSHKLVINIINLISFRLSMVIIIFEFLVLIPYIIIISIIYL